MFRDRLEFVEAAHRLGLRPQMIADASGVAQQRVSDFLQHRRLAESASLKIKTTIEKISFLCSRYQPIRLYFDSPATLNEAYETSKWVKESGAEAAIQRLMFPKVAPEVSSVSEQHGN
jgi:hypothetical protein